MQVYLIVGSSNSSIREESDAVNSNKRSSDSIQVMVWSKPNVGHLKVFGCIAYAHIPDQQRQNLDKKLRFIGYDKKSKGYRLINGKTMKAIIQRDVVFNETVFNYSGEVEDANI